MMEEKQPIDTLNLFGVAVQGDKTIILLPPSAPMTSEQALQLAAWLVVVNYERIDDFDDLLDRVLNT